MKRMWMIASLCLLLFGWNAAAQDGPAEAPASKEDVEKYLQVMHSQEMMGKMVDAMAKPMHQMIHQQYVKDKDKLPADFEARMNKMMDESMKSFPWDEMIQSMVPVYQKHFTKGDIDALVTFYSTPTGQKLLQEMPAVTAETMQSVMPLLQKHVEAMNERMQQEIAAMKKETDEKTRKKAPIPNN
jgi:uncharacterized protein